jgi:hypothetical protein
MRHAVCNCQKLCCAELKQYGAGAPICTVATCLNTSFQRISLFHRAFQFNIYNGPTNVFACNKTLIQMSRTKTFKITPTCFDHQLIIIRELFDPG